MENYFPSKTKRKDLEDDNDDFSDFSISAPATKIPRLDVELFPTIEDKCDIPVTLEHSPPKEQGFGNNSLEGLSIEELHSFPENEDRALVLFKPMSTSPLLQSPSNFSVSVDPQLISGFKNQVLWSGNSNSWRLLLPNDEAAATEDNKSCSVSPGNGPCLAVVPWVPSQLPFAAEVSSQIDNSDMMDVEEMENTTMDIEDSPYIEAGDQMTSSEGLHQWHCMIPQPPHNTTTPIFWYR